MRRYHFDCWAVLLRFVEALLLRADSEAQAANVAPMLLRHTTLLAERPAEALDSLQRNVWPAVNGHSYVLLGHYMALVAALLQVLNQCPEP